MCTGSSDLTGNFAKNFIKKNHEFKKRKWTFFIYLEDYWFKNYIYYHLINDIGLNNFLLAFLSIYILFF